MIALAAVIVVCATVLRLGVEAKRFLAGVQADAHTRATADARIRDLDAARQFELDERRVAVQEREIKLKEKQFAPPPKAEPMPPDLQDRIIAWEDVWMQEQERQTLQSMYAEYGDWAVVRNKLAPLGVVTSTDIAAPRDGMVQ